MILYFANRKMEILGQASTRLPKGLTITEDVKTEEVETGVATFSCRVPFGKDREKVVEGFAAAGNYLLRSDGDHNEFYTIIETEDDTKSRDVYIYAEDAGLDLLNETLLPYAADKAYPLSHYISKFTHDSGFELGINESNDSETKQLGWEDEGTATERLLDTADKFGFELSFSFAIERMAVTHKYVNIHVKRGKDIGAELRLNRDIDQIITKKTVANLATALLCGGATPEGSDIPINLSGYAYDDGDFFVEGRHLKSRNALAKWSRYVWADEPGQLAGYNGHIVKTFTYDTVSQAELCKQAVAELKKACELEANYEVEIARLPDSVRIGDRANIIDDEGELYLSARILKLEVSVTENKRTATLGEYLIKESGISQKVEELAKQFSEIAKARTLYTWFAYADDENGSNISLDPDGKAYLGVLGNQAAAEPDISDPSKFNWTKVQGADGQPGVDGRPGQSIQITETAITYQIGDSGTTVPTGTWSATVPSVPDGKFLWTKTNVSYSDHTETTSYSVSKNGEDGSPGVDGSPGASVSGVTRYYKLGTVQPPKPPANPPAGWTTTEPGYTAGSTSSLYAVDLAVFSDGAWAYSEVSRSSSYEAAKDAYAKALQAQTTADGKNTAYYLPSQPSVDGKKINDIWFDTSDGYKMHFFDGTGWVAAQFDTDAIAVGAIDSGNIKAGAVTAGKISVDSIQAISANIAGFVIGPKYIANGTTIIAGSDNSVYLGTDGVSLGKKFKVLPDGSVYMSGASISGGVLDVRGSAVGSSDVEFITIKNGELLVGYDATASGGKVVNCVELRERGMTLFSPYVGGSDKYLDYESFDPILSQTPSPSNGWTWVRYGSGRCDLECAGTFSALAFSEQGSVFISDEKAIAYPFKIYDARPVGTAQGGPTTPCAFCLVTQTSSGISFKLQKGGKIAINAVVNLHVRGRWE